MNVRRVMLSLLMLFVLLALPVAAFAQSEAPTGQIELYATYPSQVIGLNEKPTFNLTLHAVDMAQTVLLSAEVPEGWQATFRGGGKVIQSVYLRAENEQSVSLRLEPPADVSAGTYTITVVAKGERQTVRFPLEVVVKEKAPARLSLKVDLPTLRGAPTTTFRFNLTLRNEGDEDLSVNLSADTMPGLGVSFKSVGKEVTAVPLNANGTKSVTLEVRPLVDLPAGTYPITVLAQGGEASATLEVAVEITGQPNLTITTPDQRLSLDAYAGKETSFKFLVRNTGTAPAHDISLNASEPSGWKVRFDPDNIPELPVDNEVTVTAYVTPSDQAIAGDYMVTVRASAQNVRTASTDFRVTVRTSTLWGLVGIVLIAVAVLVVALAVMRFGRR